LQFHPEHTAQKLWKSPSITTALSPYIGYYKASQLANEMKNTHSDIFTANQRLHLIDPEKLQDIMRTENLLKLGYSLNEL
jgi:aspartate ammonia-lyase